MSETRGSQALRVIQVGLGGFGRSWYRKVLTQNPDVDVVAVVDKSEESLDALRRETAVPAARSFGDLSSAITEVAADCVVISASLPAHVPLATAALTSGLHVLMEKPFAESVEAAQTVVETARRVDRILMISQNYRFFPAPQFARSLVADQRLGRLGVIHADFRRNQVRYADARAAHYRLANPLIVDMSIHHFDLMRMITGADATRVRCSTWSPPYSSYNDPPGAELTIEMGPVGTPAAGSPAEGSPAHGPIITYRGSWCSTDRMTPWGGEWRMEFENGAAAWSSRGDETGRADRFWIRPFGADAAGPRLFRQRLPRIAAADRAGSLAAFVTAIRSGVEPDTSGRRNLGSTALVYAALRASRSGAWEEVPQA